LPGSREYRKGAYIYMKKSIYLMLLVFLLGLCTGCSREKIESPNISIEKLPSQTEELTSQTEELTSQTEEQEHAITNEKKDFELNDKLEIDYTYDYSEDIKADVEGVISGSACLQEEIQNVEKVIQKYMPLAENAQTQMEMNISSQWLLAIWDTELNNLWSRLSDLADEQTKERLLAEQRNWIAMKDEVVLLSLGTSEENGSMYPLLMNSFLEEITKNRATILANELAKLTGEFYTMPEASEKYGLFVDNQGTGEVYSSLVTRQGWEGEDEAIISIYRQGEIEGVFTDNGNGELIFTSDDGMIKGIIQINGWDGASFSVTESSENSIFSVGEEFEFPFVF